MKSTKAKTFEEQHPTTVLMKSTATWGGLPFSHLLASPIPFIRRGVGDAPCLALTVAGQSEVRWSVGPNDYQMIAQAGSLVYLDRDYELEKFSSNGELGAIVLELDVQKVEQLTGRDLSAGALLSRHLPRHIVDGDQHLSALMCGMEMEIRNGCPSGRLYAESISLAIVSYLWGKFSVRHSARELNGLSPARLVTLREYLKANLDQDVSLMQMAGIAGLSPKHLSRCFKQATGESPYQYLLKLRTDEAKRLLRRSNLSMTQVALSTGFSAQSHFSTAFRKVTGLSPSQFRQSL